MEDLHYTEISPAGDPFVARALADSRHSPGPKP
jgi:hypothetical protein